MKRWRWIAVLGCLAVVLGGCPGKTTNITGSGNVVGGDGDGDTTGHPPAVVPPTAPVVVAPPGSEPILQKKLDQPS